MVNPRNIIDLWRRGRLKTVYIKKDDQDLSEYLEQLDGPEGHKKKQRRIR